MSDEKLSPDQIRQIKNRDWDSHGEHMAESIFGGGDDDPETESKKLLEGAFGQIPPAQAEDDGISEMERETYAEDFKYNLMRIYSAKKIDLHNCSLIALCKAGRALNTLADTLIIEDSDKYKQKEKEKEAGSFSFSGSD